MAVQKDDKEGSIKLNKYGTTDRNSFVRIRTDRLCRSTYPARYELSSAINHKTKFITMETWIFYLLIVLIVSGFSAVVWGMQLFG